MVVYSCASFFNERDVLEIRLREQAAGVDVFVLAEAAYTYAGTPKPIRLEGEWRPWLEALARDLAVEVRVVSVTDPPDPARTVYQEHYYPHARDRWARENHQRAALIRGLGDLRDDDIVVLSDLDEIVRPSVANWYAAKDLRVVLMPPLPMHVAKIDLRWNEALPVIARLARGAVVRQLGTEGLRQVLGTPIPLDTDADYYDALSRYGWHLSYLGGADAIRYKLAEAAHPEMVAAALVDDALAGRADLFGRGHRLPYRVPYDGLPPCVQADPDRWRDHLLYPVEAP